jgi:molybdate transport system permease protein
MLYKRYFDLTLTLFLTLILVMITYIILGLLRPVNSSIQLQYLLQSDTLESMVVSVTSILMTLAFNSVVGTLLAFKMFNKKGSIYKVLHSVIMLPLLLPPTVAGLVLLQGFGSQSLLSRFLFEGNLHLAFEFMGIVLTQVFVTLPYFYQMTLSAFKKVDDHYIDAAKVCGADSAVLLKHIMIPMSKESMLAGLFLSGLRGLSEFGATMMFAGNMVGKTQTMTTRIYQLYQVDIGAAYSLALFQLLVFIIPFAVFVWKQETMTRKERD